MAKGAVEDNMYVVEKILDKRINRSGNLSILFRQTLISSQMGWMEYQSVNLGTRDKLIDSQLNGQRVQ